MAAKKRARLIVFIVVLLLLAGAALYLAPRFMGRPPEIKLPQPLTHLGREARLAFSVESQTGLSQVTVQVQQGSKQAVLLDQRPSGGVILRVSLAIRPLKVGLEQGPALVVISARDRSWGNWFRGRVTRRELKVVVDTLPPRIAVLSRIIRVTRGGSGIALYRLSPDAVSHGVMVDGRVFQGVTPWKDRPHSALCYFAYPQDLPKGATIKLWAQDQAGNRMETALPVRVRWKRFRHDDIKLSQRAMQALAARFADRLPPKAAADALAGFRYVNVELRKENNARIHKLTSPTTTQQLWHQPFLRPRGAPMAGFADRRTYFYQGRQVSKAVHLGIDLADVAHSPVKAAARGRVAHAGPLGIYGNAVVLDHGQGLYSLYGHLSSLGVKPGQMVERGAQVGRSGATGLALGDHLHFSVLVGGVFVNPAEWWDPHWIADNITRHFQETGLPQPTAQD